MSQFKRTCADLEKLETGIKTLKSTTNPIPIRKTIVDQLSEQAHGIRTVTNKFVAKADAGERDVNKRIYGKNMVQKVRDLALRLEKVESELGEVKENIEKEWNVWEEEERKMMLEKKEEERKEKERLERERLEKEEKDRIVAEEERKKLEIEEKKRVEKERLMEEKRKAEEEERKKKELEEKRKLRAEEEERKRVEREKESEAQRKKNEEEEAAKKKANATDGGEVSLSVKTAGGETFKVPVADLNSTVASLKASIEKSRGIPSGTQRLIFAGRLLDASKKLSDYKVQPESVVHLVTKGYNPAQKKEEKETEEVKPMVAPGSVHHLTRGAEELQAILKSCGKMRLAVVDWSAPWCGPCRAIAPAFERMAGRFRDVSFVSIDTEASPANASLAQEAQISAYPTFHFYANMQRAHMIQGANATNIERCILQYREAAAAAGARIDRSPTGSLAGASSSSSPSANNRRAPRELQQRVMRALQNLKSNCVGSEFIVAVRTLLTFVRNVTDHPNDAKYRKVRAANTAFRTRLASKQGGVECMKAFGFESKHENGEEFLILSDEAAHHPELRTVKNQLEEALGTIDPSVGRSSSSGIEVGARAAGTGVGSAATGAPRTGGGGSGSMMRDDGNRTALSQDPPFTTLAEQMMQDPEALAAAQRVQQMVQRGDPNAITVLQNNPALQRLQRTVMENPQLLQQVMGLGGMAGGAGMEQDSGGGESQIPGAPRTALEEEQMLQQAIQMSMEEENETAGREGSGNDGGKNEESEKKERGGAD